MSFQPTIITEKGNTKTQMDLPTKFYEERSIFLTGMVNDEMAESIVQQLLYLDKLNNDTITLYINTPGGYCHSGLAILDAIELIDSPVHAIVMGEACSMGATILCRCDYRSALAGAVIMFHQISGGAYGNYQDMKVAIEHAETTNNLLLHKIAEGCGKTVKQVQKDMSRDFYLTPKGAKEYGAIDNVITPKPNREGKRNFKYE